jgi:hypothetical protein
MGEWEGMSEWNDGILFNRVMREEKYEQRMLSGRIFRVPRGNEDRPRGMCMCFEHEHEYSSVKKDLLLLCVNPQPYPSSVQRQG